MEKITPVIPDGEVKLILPDGKLCYILPEIDMDTESNETIEEKITSYIPYIESGQFARDYGIAEVPLIVFYTPTEKRRDELIRLVDRALLTSYNGSKSSWFRIGYGELSPELFFERIWITPEGLKQRKQTSLFAM